MNKVIQHSTPEIIRNKKIMLLISQGYSRRQAKRKIEREEKRNERKLRSVTNEGD